MAAPPADPLKDAFLRSLDGEESLVQTFLEQNSEVFHFPFYIGETIQWDSIISKFPLDTSLETDFAYITRHSGEIDFVFVELEKPSKKIFLPDHPQLKPTEEFNTAVAQIDTWKHYVSEHRDAVIAKLAPLLSRPWIAMSEIKFKYVLIYGRESEFQGRDDKRQRWNKRQTEDTHYMTFDSIWNRYRPAEKSKNNVLRLEGQRYAFKHLYREPDMFGYLGPDRIALSAEDEAKLKSWGYDIDAWKDGKLLPFGGKRATWT